MEKLIIHKENKQIDASEADLSGSKFHMVMLNDWELNDVAMKNCKIVNANLSDLEIEGAQIGGAFIHNIGGPPPGHPAHNPDFVQRSIRFEDCNLANLGITNCNLTDLSVTDCNLTGFKITDCNLADMTIEGVSVKELLRIYREHKRQLD